jgi:hypothetical protein
MPKYHICFTCPPGYPHARVFNELFMLLIASIRELGYDCTMEINNLKQDRINILIGYHLISFEEGLKDFQYIPFQLEQLDSDHVFFKKDQKKMLKHSLDIWDFSPVNQKFLKGFGWNSTLVKMGYNKILETMPKSPEKLYDVIFYGSINDRRQLILDQLQKVTHLKILFNAYGAERDEQLSRAKVIVNMHHFNSNILETVRLSYLLNNGSFIVAENSSDDPYGAINLQMSSYEQLAERCHYFAQNDKEREAIQKENYEQFKKHYPMTEILEPILKKH